MDIVVSSTEATNISESQWYILKNRGRNGYAYENSGSMRNQASAPCGSATDNAAFLVRFLNAGDNSYYLQNGLSNYWGAIPENTAVPATPVGTEKYTIGTIGSNAGHYYLTSETNSIVLDCQANGNPVVGWGTTVPTSTGGNNDWAFYPVTLSASFAATDDDIFTINNTNTSRGALTYDPSQNARYVWSSGKSGATTLDASNVNHQWIFYPTGTSGQYYLYNVGAQKFVMPSGVGSGAANAWYFSDNAVALKLERQSDGTSKIKLAVDPVYGTNAAYIAVSNGQTYPIINYNDEGGNFTLTKVGTASSAIQTQRDAAVGKLVNQQTALTTYPNTSGWYAIQIKSKTGSASYANRYLYTASSLYNNLYPLTFTGNIPTEPAITDPTFFTYLNCTSWDVNTWQMPDGRYLVDNGSNKFPTASATAGNVIAGYSNGNYFKTDNSYYADPNNSNNNYFIGETTTYRTAYNVYPIDLTAAGLTAWQVTITNAGSSTQLTCTRSDVSGLTSVYNNGWFFLPAGTTPENTDFTLSGMTSCTVDATNHTITAVFDPELSITADEISVIQGHQTTGKGSTMQPLLRIKATPFSDFQPTQFSISLSGAAQVDNVKVYSTAADQINFAGVTPTLLGTTASPSDGTVDISVTASSVSADATNYYWITADVKSAATEWETIDASLSSISYTNSYKTTNSLSDTELDLSSIGDPDGSMRIYKSKSVLWTSSKSNARYYRIPALLKTGTNTLLAFTDDRYASHADLGNHKIDVLVKKSTDGGLTWGNAVTVAAGDGSSAAGYGYGDAAVAQAANGDIVCLMAAGRTGFGSGMLHIGYTKSTDGGATWSTPVDIYDNSTYLTNPHATGTTTPFISTFVSSGHGITQTVANSGRIAFPALGKISSGTNEYVIYSDDNGATWTFTDNYGFSGADESKLEEMNDGTLLMSIRRGSYNGTGTARGYNRTTDTGVENWGTQGTWSDLVANGCNSDLLYYSRSTAGKQDVLLHSVVKTYSKSRKDLRLYMSLDQGATWKEAFQLQPGYAAYSSMQVLDNGDLAILFEDGTIGIEDEGDCYDISYVVLSKELMEEKIEEFAEEKVDALTDEVKVAYDNTAPTTYGDFNAESGWRQSWTSKVASGNNTLAGVTVASEYSGAFNQSSNIYSKYVLAVKVSATNATDNITITAPTGYKIASYTLKARSYNSGKNYTLTSGTTTVTTGTGSWSDFTITGVNNTSATFTVTTDQDQSNYLCVSDFLITVVPEDAPSTCTVNIINPTTGTTVETGTIAYGTSLANCVAATPKGDLSPLVSYTPSYDFSTNTYKVSYTVQSTDVNDATWYFARLRETNFVSYDAMADVRDGYGYPVNASMTTFGPEYQWAFVGDPYDKVQIFNNAAGRSNPLTTRSNIDNERLRMVEGGTTWFEVKAYGGGFVFNVSGETDAYINDVGNSLGLWRNSNGATDAGSVMKLIDNHDVEDLQSYVADAFSNYMGKYFGDGVTHHWGAVGDFTSQNSYSALKSAYDVLLANASTLPVAQFNAFLTAVNGSLVKLSTGNYRLLNKSTGKYLGHNETFDVRGYSEGEENGANGISGGAYGTGQYLSTIWNINVSDHSVSASGKYMGASTVLNAAGSPIVFGSYPLTYALGSNGFGTFTSSSDDVVQSTASVENDGNDGNKFAYKADAAQWVIIPAEQTTFTLTANAVSPWSYATFYAPFDTRIETDGTYAYVLKEEDVDHEEHIGVLTTIAEKDGIIPAGTAVVLINKNAKTTLVFTPMNTNEASFEGENIIRGTYQKIVFSDVDPADYLIFGKNSSNEVGFFKPKSTAKLLPNRSYLDNSAGSLVAGLRLLFRNPDDSTLTAITAVGTDAEGSAQVYDLQGRRVQGSPRSGIYIVGGKKTYVK